MIPTDFDSWKTCIEQQCGIPLTVEFAKQRLALYTNRELPETRQFIRLYGHPHYARIVHWFGQIAHGGYTTG